MYNMNYHEEEPQKKNKTLAWDLSLVTACILGKYRLIFTLLLTSLGAFGVISNQVISKTATKHFDQYSQSGVTTEFLLFLDLKHVFAWCC